MYSASGQYSSQWAVFQPVGSIPASGQTGQQSRTSQDRLDHKKTQAKASGSRKGMIYMGDGLQRGGITDGRNEREEIQKR